MEDNSEMEYEGVEWTPLA